MPYRHVVMNILLVSLLSNLVIACSASSRVVRVYDGSSQDESQVARLETPATIKVLSIDGQRQKTYLTDSISMTYEMLPGAHTIVYQYASIWSVPRGVQRQDFAEDTAKVQNVDSSPISADIDLAPGGRYRIQHAEASNIRDAYKLAADFSADILAESGEHIAQQTSDNRSVPNEPGVDLTAVSPGETPAAGSAKAVNSIPSADRAVAIESESNVVVKSGTDHDADADSDMSVSRLEGLKILWGKATQADKAAFLSWAFE